MQISLATDNPTPRNEFQYALRPELGFWRLTFDGRPATFKHEQGALYVACLLWDPPREPLHAVALALKARGVAHRPGAPEWDPEELDMGLQDAVAVRALWRRQRELERVLADRWQIEPVKAEALRELEEITERLRQSPWLSHHGAERCVRAVAVAIKRVQARLAAAVDLQGQPDEVLRAFAGHLFEHLLIPSGRGGGRLGPWLALAPPGCFTYAPPNGVVWEGTVRDEGGRMKPEAQRHGGDDGRGLTACPAQMRSQTAQVASDKRLRPGWRSAAADYLASFPCAGLALGLLVTGCAGPHPLQGGQAISRRDPGGLWQQSLVQGENPSQASKQEQASARVRTYTLPAGSRLVSDAWRGTEGDSQVPGATRPDSRPSTLAPQAFYLLSAPMPVTEREEMQTRTELGSAQKDMARELGASLSSLEGIVWVGAGLFVFGLASLVWPPLKALIASVTTSAALMAGGLALMVLPSLVVGHELVLLGGVAVAVGGWFLAHRHGQLSGKAALSPSTPEPGTP